MAPTRLRRQPPAFRSVEVRRTEALSPRLLRVLLTGEDLVGFEVPAPAASVRLLLPPPGSDEVEIPTWNGNEFLRSDGTRPVIRTYTPRYVDPSGDLVIDVVIHPQGVAAAWAMQARPGAAAAISGPGRGYDIDAAARNVVLAGDESALPAISQLLEHLPPEAEVDVAIEVADPAARVALPGHPGARVTWHDLPTDGDPGATLLTAVRALPFADDAHIWVAGEAAGVQRIRRHLFDERGVERSRAVVRGYWKQGRAG